jgi:hypothetical protein
MPKKFLVIFDSELAGVPTFSKLTRQMSNKVPQSVLAFFAAPDFNYLHTIDRTEGQIARCFQKTILSPRVGDGRMQPKFQQLMQVAPIN